MIQTDNLRALLEQGGTATLILLFCSVLSLAVAIGKWIAFQGTREADTDGLAADVARLLAAGDPSRALARCRDAVRRVGGLRVPLALAPVLAYLAEHAADALPDLEERALARLDRAVSRLERGLGVLATLGSVSPFIGLFGTVVGIIRSFEAVSTLQAAAYSGVMTGIAEALVSTAAGLVVAVPSVIFYNYFIKRLRRWNRHAGGAVVDVLAQVKALDRRAAPPDVPALDATSRTRG